MVSGAAGNDADSPVRWRDGNQQSKNQSFKWHSYFIFNLIFYLRFLAFMASVRYQVINGEHEVQFSSHAFV